MVQFSRNIPTGVEGWVYNEDSDKVEVYEQQMAQVL